MNANIKRIFSELQADARVQAMHRANIAKRKAAKAARRAAMIARRNNKSLPAVCETKIQHTAMQAAILCEGKAYDQLAAWRERENKKAEENNLPGVKVAPEQVKEIMQADAAYLVGKVTADNVKDFAANILAMIK